MKIKNTARRAGMVVAAVLSLAAIATPTAIAAEVFAQAYGPLYSGDSYRNGGIYHGSYAAIAGQSTGTAFSGVWIANSSGTRVSADAYCATAGCAAFESWSSTSTPAGNPVVHNHGNASPSYFGGTDSWY